MTASPRRPLRLAAVVLVVMLPFDAASKGPRPAAPRGRVTVSHTPPAEQLADTPVPVYCELSPEPKDATVTLWFQERDDPSRERGGWTWVEMSRQEHGFAAEIPCTGVTRYVARYFLEARDGADPVGESGSFQKPHEVKLVDQRTTDAPALHGLPPPARCWNGYPAHVPYAVSFAECRPPSASEFVKPMASPGPPPKHSP